MVGGFIDDVRGIIWWTLKQNHYQSVFFTINQLEDIDTKGKALEDVLTLEEEVTFEAVRNSAGPSNWIARKVFTKTK